MFLGRRVVVRFTIAYAISAYHHQRDLQLPMQSVPITTNVISNPDNGKVYLKHYVMGVYK